jgi:hypothetical protein
MHPTQPLRGGNVCRRRTGLALLLALLCFSAPAQGQRPATSGPALPPADSVAASFVRAESGARPAWRTAGAVLGSAAGYAIAQSVAGGNPDDVLAPVAAGLVGGALGSAIFTNAHPLRVLLGSALAAVPAAAMASFVAGSMEDDAQEPIPLISFSLPHGLLTSAFSQHRTPSDRRDRDP